MRPQLLLTILLLSLAATLGAADAVEPKPSPRPSSAAATSLRPPAGRQVETGRPDTEKDRALELIFADDFEGGDTSRWGGRCSLSTLDLPLPARRRR